MRAGYRGVATVAVTSVVLAIGLSEARAGAASPQGAARATEREESVLATERQDSAFALARRSGQRVEVTGLRGETQTVYANPSGTYTLEQYAQPIRVRRGTSWVPVDTTLHTFRDGSVRPAATAMTMAFSGGGGSALARIDVDGKELALGWAERLPVPVLDANTATYHDVLPDVDLVVTAGVLGFSDVFVVKTAAAARSADTLRLTSRTTGLRAQTDAGGNVRLLDPSGAEVLHIGTPTAWDSAGRAVPVRDRVTGPPDGARRAQVQTSVDAGSFGLRAGGLLTDPNTRFPVYVDPNPSYSGSRVAWTSVWAAYPNSSHYNSSDIARVGHETDTGMTNRSFFTMNTTGIRGKHIVKATFRTYEVWSWACPTSGHNQNVELWTTGAISSGTTWNNQPAKLTHLSNANVAKGYSSACPAGGVEFDATTAAVSAASHNQTSVTLGLYASTETDPYGWKKFQNNPALVVEYNTPPTASGPVLDPFASGQSLPCVTGANRPVIGTTTPTVRVKISDADRGQPVGARFQWAVAGGSKVGEVTTTKVTTSGALHSVRLSGLTNGGTYSWHARAEDGTDVSAWTGLCEFKVDTTKPKPPTVASGDYPATPPGQDPVYRGGIGVPGTFTFTPAAGDTDISRYVYGFTYPPSTWTVNATGTGLSATVTVSPPADLLNTLYVAAVDRAGNVNANNPTTYEFYVRPVTFPVGQWNLDETGGTVAADSSDLNRPASFTGGAAWTSGRIGGAARFNGTDTSAATGGPVLRTDASFSVAAWVRLTATYAQYSALSQDGTRNSGFHLDYDPAVDRWAMEMTTADTDTETLHRVVSNQPPKYNVWTHLVGVYDKSAGQLRLYVDGVLQGSTAHTGAWNATGPLQIGRSKWHGFLTGYWSGDVDDVRVYQGVVPDDMIKDLAHPPAQLLAQWNLDETTGTSAADESGAGHTATLTGGTAWTDGWDAGALRLDGVDAAASTTSAIVRTDEAFTVAAWVWFDGSTAVSNFTVLSQDGDAASGFHLGREYYTGAWGFWMPTSDASDAPSVFALSPQPAAVSTWTHLAAVYDPSAQQLRLYVDGVLMALTTYSGGWHAANSMQLGRARWGGWHVNYWPGAVDDVRVYQGALTDDEIYELTLQ